MDVIFLLGNMETKVIAATVELGVAAYVNEVERNTSWHDTDLVMAMADRVTGLTDKMCKLREENEGKEIKVNVTEEE